MFYSWQPVEIVALGDWLYIIFSAVGVLTGVYNIWEARDFSHFREEMTDLTDKGRTQRNEFLEHLMFVGANTAFVLGSLCFMPGIYGDNEDLEARGESLGAWLFISGSVMLVMADFFSSGGMSHDPEHQNLRPGTVRATCHTLSVTGLAISLLGAVAFVVGSVLFRPIFDSS